MLRVGYSAVITRSKNSNNRKFASNVSMKIAAHCVENRAQNGVIVVVGTNYLDAGGSQHQSQRIVLHPEYDNVTLAYE